ncbi:MAG: hypothetical protein BJ554DRAFT_3329, partial [Olpidium bornovanus]
MLSAAARPPPAAARGIGGDDRIIVRDLFVRTVIGVDAWERWKEQPVKVTVTLHTDIGRVGATDLLANTVNYGTVAKSVTAFSESAKHTSLEALAGGIARSLLDGFPPAAKAVVRVERPKSLLHARTSGVEITRTRAYTERRRALLRAAAARGGEGEDDDNDDEEGDVVEAAAADAAGGGPADLRARFPEDERYTVHVGDLRVNAIIGVNPWERMERQAVVLNLTVRRRSRGCGGGVDADRAAPYSYRTMVRRISEFVEASSYKTVEALTTAVARIAVEECNVEEITVRVEKPSALAFAEAAGVEITRTRRFFEDMDNSEVEEEIRHGPASRHVEPPSAVAAVRVPAVPGTPRPPPAPSPRGPADPAGRSPSSLASPSSPPSSAGGRHVAFVALGSNLGVLHANIFEALRRLEAPEPPSSRGQPGSPSAAARCSVLDTSFLYQTTPMYVEEQPAFLNAACKVTKPVRPPPSTPSPPQPLPASVFSSTKANSR